MSIVCCDRHLALGPADWPHKCRTEVNTRCDFFFEATEHPVSDGKARLGHDRAGTARRVDLDVTGDVSIPVSAAFQNSVFSTAPMDRAAALPEN
jgi:hypothetical protein